MNKLKSLWAYLTGNAIFIDLRTTKTALVTQNNTFISLPTKNLSSAVVAAWALERPEHFWISTKIGVEILETAKDAEIGVAIHESGDIP